VEGTTRSAFGKADALAPVLDELCTLADSLPESHPRVLVVDDLDTIEDPMLTSLWERVARAESIRVVATVETRSLGGFSTNPVLNEIRKARRALHLQPDDPTEFFQTTGVKPPIRPGTPMPPGRGVLVVDRRPSMIQVGIPHLAAGIGPGSGGAPDEEWSQP
jgi:S-DNA-T family DNA segregation ATPase FtsK/SpoIIIE